jgi:hypothetical protein
MIMPFCDTFLKKFLLIIFERQKPPGFQAVLAFGLVGQLLLFDVSRRLMVHHDDVIKVDTDMRHQLIRFGVDRMAVVELRCGWGNQPLVVPALLVAAFSGFAYLLKFDVLLSICNLL